MRVVSAENQKDQPFDIPSGLCRILIAKGFVVEYTHEMEQAALLASNKIPGHNFQWTLERTQDGSPFLFGDCPACKPKARYAGPNPEAKCFHFHQGTKVVPSKQLIAGYLELYEIFNPKPGYIAA